MLIPCFWPEVRRGAERIAHELSLGLISAGASPEIITSHPRRVGRGEEEGVPVVRSWRPPDGRLRRRLFEDYLTHVPLSYLQLQRGDYDLAEAFHPPDALAAARWGRRHGRPSILYYMGLPDRQGLAHRRMRVKLTLRAVAECDVVVALSHAVADTFGRTLGVEARVIYPPVDLASFTPADVREERPTIVCAADPDEPRKQIDTLVEAFGEVRRHRPDARLELMRPRDTRRAESLSAEAGVTLLDRVQRSADLAPAYQRAWLSALPAAGEAFGVVIAESLACGTPVVGRRAGAIPEILDRESVGVLFDGGAAELGRALLEGLTLAEEPETRSSCRRRAEDFSVERCVTEHLALYEELLGVRAGPA